MKKKEERNKSIYLFKSFSLSAITSINKERFNSSISNVEHFWDLIFGTEIWALLIVLFLQDLPFAIIRLIILATYNQLSKNYTLYFFVIKNIILAGSEIHLIIVIYLEVKKKSKLNRNNNSNNINMNNNDEYFHEATTSI